MMNLMEPARAIFWRLMAWLGMHVLYRRRHTLRRLLFLFGVAYVVLIWTVALALARVW